MSAGRVAAFGWALDVAHDVADHVVQTDQQAAGKATASMWANDDMLGHLAGQAVCQGAAVALCSTLAGRPSWGRVAAALALSVGTHGLLDRRWPVTRLLEATGSPRFARTGIVAYPDPLPDATDRYTATLPLHGPYLADQALHRAALLAAAVILGGGRRG